MSSDAAPACHQPTSCQSDCEERRRLGRTLLRRLTWDNPLAPSAHSSVATKRAELGVQPDP